MTGRRERRRIASEQRDDRRDTIRNLLARVDRAAAGRINLTAAEAAQLRAQVEAEIAHAEDLRRSTAGAQSLTRTLRQQLAAAEDAIREVEADRDAAHQLPSQERPTRQLCYTDDGGNHCTCNGACEQ
ncbi:hypothetical protein [Actinacidiphila glaucinigra]|uniref:hypothetical protein n=1 Tax=Actinacidiphila glaucinigra TaxID=235986 RepID=UPI003D8EC579